MNLFFYGTLRAAEVRRAVLGNDLKPEQLIEGTLFGFTVRRVSGALYPMLVAGTVDDKVEGLVALDVDGQSVDKLDRFEGAHYSRQSFKISTADGCLDADVYLPDASMIPAQMWDFDGWYKHDMVGFLAQDFDLQGVKKPSG